MIKKILITAIIILSGFVILYAYKPDINKDKNSPFSVSNSKYIYDNGITYIDLEKYPNKKKDYNHFTRFCGKCHPVSRSINAPYQGDQWYMITGKMNIKKNAGIPLDQAKKIVSFLKWYTKEKIKNPFNFQNSWIDILFNYYDYSFNEKNLTFRKILFDFLKNKKINLADIKMKKLPKNGLNESVYREVLLRICLNYKLYKKFISYIKKRNLKLTTLSKKYFKDNDLSKVILETRRNKKSLHNGYTLYQSYCASCHGKKGEGGIGLTLNNSFLLSLFLRKNGEFYKKTINLGRDNTPMQAYLHDYYGIFNETQIENIVFFFKKNWFDTLNPKPQIKEDLPFYPLKPNVRREVGKQLFQENCSKCHGKFGHGIHDNNETNAPAIRNNNFSSFETEDGKPLQVSNQLLREIIKNGRITMPPFERNPQNNQGLTPEQIDSIIKYIRPKKKTE